MWFERVCCFVYCQVECCSYYFLAQNINSSNQKFQKPRKMRSIIKDTSKRSLYDVFVNSSRLTLIINKSETLFHNHLISCFHNLVNIPFNLRHSSIESKADWVHKPHLIFQGTSIRCWLKLKHCLTEINKKSMTKVLY